MKSSGFLEEEFAGEREAMLQVVNAENDNFGVLVALSGLNPAVDFRHKNLDDVDFTDTDLRGYDFTGASLRRAQGANVQWDETTILTGADFGGSLFDVGGAGSSQDDGLTATRSEMDAIFRRSWQDQIIWLDSLSPRSPDFVIELSIAFDMFIYTDDSFVRRSALQAIAANLNTETLSQLLINYAEATRTDAGIRSAAFHVLKVHALKDRKGAVKVGMELLRTHWRDYAFVFLAEHLADTARLRPLTEYVRRVASPIVRRLYVGALASRHGLPTTLMMKDPVTGDTADVDEKFDADRIARVANVMRSRLDDDLRNGHKGAYAKEFEKHEAGATMRLHVRSRLKSMRAYGLQFAVPSVDEVLAFKFKSLK